MEYFRTLLVLLCLFSTTTAQSRNHTGRDFVVAFFRNLDLRKFDAYLLLASVGKVNVTATVFYQKDPVLTSSFQISHKIVEQFSLENFGKINMMFPVLRIKASDAVSITAFVDGPTSAASYLVFPQDVAGVEYRMMPFCNKTANGLCVCSIVTLSNNTSIILENENHGNISVYTSKHAVGEDTVDYLSLPHSLTSFRIKDNFSHVSLESRDDFTGLLLRANQSVVVFCGGMILDSTMSMEQVPPVEYFGFSFYPFTYSTVGLTHSKLRFISHYNCTTIETVYGKHNQDAGEFREIPHNQFAINPYKKIHSDKPIAIMQTFSSSSEPNTKYPNDSQEGLLLLPAIDQYLSSVIIPRRRKKYPNMVLGFIYEVSFNYTFTKLSGDQVFYKTTTSRWFAREYDDIGTSIKLTQNGCQGCGNENSFGVYIYRTNIHLNDASLSMVGYQFIPRRIQTHNYSGDPCRSKNVDTHVSKLNRQSSTLEEVPIFVEQTSSDDMSITMDYSKNSFDESSKQPKITTVSIMPQCKCQTDPEANTNIQTEEQLQEKIKEIKKELSINRNDLSSYRRRKTSVDDDRASAKGIGIVGASILCAFVSFIIFMDLKTLAHQGTLLWRRALGKNVRGSSKSP